MERNKKITCSATILIVLTATLSITAILLAESTTTAKAGTTELTQNALNPAWTGSLYAGDHIITYLAQEPTNMQPEGYGKVYVANGYIGTYHWAMFEKDGGEIVIYVW